MNQPSPAFGAVSSQELAASTTISTEQLCQVASELAQNHMLEPNIRRKHGRTLIRRFRDNADRLRFLNREFRQSVRKNDYVPQEADWILDNFFVIEEQLQEIDNDLPPTYLDELPRVVGGEPRVYLLAHEVVARMDAALDEDSLSQYLDSYQRTRTLSIGEMWAFPIMLRIALVERLRRLADQLWLNQQAHDYATRVVERFRRTNRFEIDDSKLMQSAVWVASQAERNQQVDSAALSSALHDRLRDVGWKLSDLERLNHQSSAMAQVSFANTITSMRLMSVVDWTSFFEDHCLAEQALRRDPSGIYASCDAATRNTYRRNVEVLSKRTTYSDKEVAEVVVELCSRNANKSTAGLNIESHVGYWLADKGLVSSRTNCVSSPTSMNV